MCVICISPKGIRQPTKDEINAMFKANPDGAGYMFINEDGLAEIHKGFMELSDFQRDVAAQKFTKSDVVIYHFRISTQGGVNPGMTHPFPLTGKLEHTKLLDCACSIGIAHNGIIPCTTDYDKEYSDTALFITEYLAKMIKSTEDLKKPFFLKEIEDLIHSKMVFLDGNGYTTVGQFITDESGLIYSNTSWKRFTRPDVNLFNKSTWKLQHTM